MRTLDKEMVPRVCPAPRGRPTEGMDTVDTKSLAHEEQEHPTTEEHPCACYSGWVSLTFEDDHDEEREASYRCRRCNAG